MEISFNNDGTEVKKVLDPITPIKARSPAGHEGSSKKEPKTEDRVKHASFNDEIMSKFSPEKDGQST